MSAANVTGLHQAVRLYCERTARESAPTASLRGLEVERRIAAAVGVSVGPETQAEKVRRLAMAWLGERPTVRTLTITEVGGELPVLARFIEGGRLVSQHRGRTETDALAQAGMLLLNGGFEPVAATLSFVETL